MRKPVEVACKACGQGVEIPEQRRGHEHILCAGHLFQVIRSHVKLPSFTQKSLRVCTPFPHAKTAVSPLYTARFSPLSTKPITMTTIY